MKKLFVLLTMLVFSSISLANGDNSLSSLFKSPQEANVTVLSQKELSGIKGGLDHQRTPANNAERSMVGYFLQMSAMSVMEKVSEYIALDNRKKYYGNYWST